MNTGSYKNSKIHECGEHLLCAVRVERLRHRFGLQNVTRSYQHHPFTYYTVHYALLEHQIFINVTPAVMHKPSRVCNIYPTNTPQQT